jgi:hypothetical protein
MSPQLNTSEVHDRRAVRGLRDRPRLQLAAAQPRPPRLQLAAPQPRPLRRWSVAQLIAQAVARPRGGGLAH